jgi:flotillin
VRDKNGYLDSLGKPRIAQVKRDADIATAEAEKETRIKRAEAAKEAKKAELERATEIAEAEKVNQLKMAEFRREQDTARANADQAYDLETARAKQEVTEQEMQIKIIERQKQIELEEKEILRRERQYDSEVKKKADADRYAVEQAASAEKAKQIAEADAHQYRVEATAKAEAERVRLDGIAKADAQRAQGETEAEVIRLKGVAEAEAKRKVAEAFEQFGQAAVLDMVLKMLPEYAKQVAAPLGNIDKITVVDTGGQGEGGANKVTGYATNLMATMQESLKASSGIDVRELLENLSGKGNVRSSIDALTDEIRASKGQEDMMNEEGTLK